MEKPERKKHRINKYRKLIALSAGVIILAACITLLFLIRSKEPSVLYREMTNGTLFSHPKQDVKAIQVTLQSGETWKVVQPDADGHLFLSDNLSAEVDMNLAEGLLSAASTVTYEDILTEDSKQYEDQLDAFGLNQPKITAVYTYNDDSEVVLHIGEQSELADETYYFMLVDGDERLFAADNGTVEFLNLKKIMLRTVEQPQIQSSRLDRITVTDVRQEKKIEWSLEGAITEASSADNWFITAPFRYPADADIITGIKKNADDLILGAYVDEDSESNRVKYGLDSPQYTIELHMAEGLTGYITENGDYETQMQPENTVRFVIGNARNEMTDYVLYNGHIYTMNHFTLDVFTGADPVASAARYPFSTAVSDLASVSLEHDGTTDEYKLFSVVKENGTDENGEPMVDTEDVCEKNGTGLSRSAFEAAWERLLVVTYTGILPERMEATEDCECIYRIKTVSGRQYTVSLFKYDALHDAVAIDGTALFYLIRNGMTELP